MCYLLKNGRFPLSSFVPYAIIENAAGNGRMHLNNTHLPMVTSLCLADKHPLLIVTPEIVDLFWLAYLARRMESLTVRS